MKPRLIPSAKTVSVAAVVVYLFLAVPFLVHDFYLVYFVRVLPNYLVLSGHVDLFIKRAKSYLEVDSMVPGMTTTEGWHDDTLVAGAASTVRAT